MEIALHNIKANDWEFSTVLSSEDIIGITGADYEEFLEESSKKVADIMNKILIEIK